MFKPVPNEECTVVTVVRRIRKVRPTFVLDPQSQGHVILYISFSEISGGREAGHFQTRIPSRLQNYYLDVTFLDTPRRRPVILPSL